MPVADTRPTSMRVSTASDAQAWPMAIAHGSDATGSKSANPPSGGVVASTFQPPPSGADARSAGGSAACCRRAAPSRWRSESTARLRQAQAEEAGTSALTAMTVTTASTTPAMMRFARRTRCGSMTSSPRGTQGARRSRRGRGRRTGHVTMVAPEAGSPSVAPQPWQRLAVGTRQICHVGFAAASQLPLTPRRRGRYNSTHDSRAPAGGRVGPGSPRYPAGRVPGSIRHRRILRFRPHNSLCHRRAGASAASPALFVVVHRFPAGVRVHRPGSGVARSHGSAPRSGNRSGLSDRRVDPRAHDCGLSRPYRGDGRAPARRGCAKRRWAW